MDSRYEILILYASQTGTSKYAGEELAREAWKRGLSTSLLSIDDYDIEKLPEEKYIIFLVSTTGQGDPPTSMKEFWGFLCLNDLPLDVLAELNFAVFGFGDSIYPKFNAMARKLNQRLLQLGARAFHERGLGDEQHSIGYEGEFIPWCEALWEKLKGIFSNRYFELKQNLKEEELNFGQAIGEMKFCVEILKGNQEARSEGHFESLPQPTGDILTGKKPLQARVLENKRVTAEEHFQDVRRVEFELPQHVSYLPGDIIAIQPRNDPNSCKNIADIMKIPYEAYVKIDINPKGFLKKSPLPNLIKISDLLEFWLNLNEPPSRYMLYIMSFLAQNPLHKSKLLEMSSKTKEGLEEYYAYCIREKRTLAEVLFDFNSVVIGLDHILEGTNLLRPREYSISSDCKTDQKNISILLALVKYKTVFQREKIGICSGWLANCSAGSVIHVWVKRGSFDFPADPKIPVIVVGPGTGIAPFISFLKYRETSFKIDELKEGATLLFFGCRGKLKDYFYRDYLEKLQSEKMLQLNVAFSRDQEFKIYVHHLIKNQSESVASVILDNQTSVRIYVAGNAKNMPKQVEDAFKTVLSLKLGSQEEAEKVLKKLVEKRQYQVETW